MAEAVAAPPVPTSSWSTAPPTSPVPPTKAGGKLSTDRVISLGGGLILFGMLGTTHFNGLHGSSKVVFFSHPRFILIRVLCDSWNDP